jgi:hypothetical protein
LAYYATQIDYDLARKSNPNANVQLYTGQKLGSGDYALGGAAAGIADNALNGATRLAGSDRYATNDIFKSQAYQDDKNAYAKQLTDYQNQLLAAKQQEKANALRSAYENNSQALNSQQNSVNNAYTSAINSINATKQAQLPQYQEQRNAASADAAQMAQKVRELMAATGRYNSGTNRSQQLAVALDRSNAIQGANSAENQFSTQIANQLSDAERNKASSLSDIADKLSLLSRQYNQGTLDLNNQIASEKAAAASKALLDAQSWSDAQRQQGIDNSFRNDQFDYQKWLQGQQLALQQKQADNGLALDVAQLMGTYNGSPTLAKQQMDADTAYKNAALARSSSGGGSYYGGATNATLGKQYATTDALSKIQDWVNEGYTPEQINALIYQNAPAFSLAGDLGDLAKTANSMYQNTHYLSGGHNLQ